jgi:hypothetical protein
MPKKVAEDLSGMVFGKLTVIRRTEKPETAKNGVYWLCVCECGSERTVVSSYLKSRPNISCKECRTTMGKVKNLEGKRFGMLVVFGFDRLYENSAYWNCRCDCGNEVSVKGTNLSSGNSTSCGCQSGGFEDLTNRKFNMLKVIKLDHRDKRLGAFWLCICDCGNYEVVRASYLKKGKHISCGCYKKETKLQERARSVHLETLYNRLFKDYRNQAKKRGLSFSIDNFQFRHIISQDCYYCGKPPSNIKRGVFGELIYNGIDRVNNSVGYDVDNVVPCCAVCNRMKMDANIGTFIEKVRKIAEFTKDFILEDGNAKADL